MKRLAAVAIAAFLTAAAPAAAQDPPAPAPADARLTLSVDRSGDRAALTGQQVRVRGRLSPAAPGETVTVRIYAGGRKVFVKRAEVDAATGAFAIRASLARAGRHSVRASHRATAALGTAIARPVALDVLPRSVDGRSGADAVRVVQRRLARHGYVVGIEGRYDARTARAVLAFRKVTGMPRVAVADLAFLRKLASGAGAFKVKFAGHGRHVEADLTRQVLALIDGGRVRRIYPISSGAPATPTILGSFRIYEKRPGTNALGMVFSLFFIRGYAIHGYESVPVYPASHGCLRVPVPDAVPIYDWLRVGDRVDVYYRR